jgi:hypothetical protein
MSRPSGTNVEKINAVDLTDDTCIAIDNPASDKAQSTLWGSIKAFIAGLYAPKDNPTFTTGITTPVANIGIGSANTASTDEMLTLLSKTTDDKINTANARNIIDVYTAVNRPLATTGNTTTRGIRLWVESLVTNVNNLITLMGTIIDIKHFGTGTASNLRALTSTIAVAPGSGSCGTAAGLTANVNVENNCVNTNMIGLITQLTTKTTMAGTVSVQQPVYGGATHDGSVGSTVTAQYGGRFQLQGGTLNNKMGSQTGILATLYPFQSAITTQYGVRILNNASTGVGSVETSYGLHIDPMLAGTTRWGFYQVATGAGTNNYFGDNILVGSVTPTAGAEKLQVTGSVSVTGTTKQSVYTVATLPVGTAGCRSFVSDATVTTFASIVAGTGANFVPVYHNGTNWLIG